jgi:putative transposase
MKYDSSKHHRQSIRLKGHDYSADGMYFITICAYQRNCLFGAIINGVMHQNEYGQIVTEEWLKSADIRQEIGFGEWVVMPNHIHGIVIVDRVEPTNFVGAHGHAPLQDVSPQPTSPNQGVALRQPKSLSTFIAGFKMAVTKRINLARNAPGTPVWQRNYYEHIIRNEAAFQTILRYIRNNSQTWESDQLHPDIPSKW